MNTVKTVMLMTALAVLLIVTGEMFAGQPGIFFGLAIALVINLAAYWYSDRFAIRLTRARPISEDEAPAVYRELRDLTREAEIPMPRVYLIPTEQLNAFAAGRNPQHSIVAVTAGLLHSVGERELRGILAHELAHIKNRDILISTVAAVLASALTAVARIGMWQLAWGGRARRQGSMLSGILMIMTIIVAPVAALLIRLAVSRAREYEADRHAALITRDPEGLASALEQMARTGHKRAYPVNEAAAHMFIVSPLSAGALSGMFSTHPPIARRVERLRRMV